MIVTVITVGMRLITPYLASGTTGPPLRCTISSIVRPMSRVRTGIDPPSKGSTGAAQLEAEAVSASIS
jgi:hypothetical protein